MSSLGGPTLKKKKKNIYIYYLKDERKKVGKFQKKQKIPISKYAHISVKK